MSLRRFALLLIFTFSLSPQAADKVDEAAFEELLEALPWTELPGAVQEAFAPRETMLRYFEAHQKLLVSITHPDRLPVNDFFVPKSLRSSKLQRNIDLQFGVDISALPEATRKKLAQLRERIASELKLPAGATFQLHLSAEPALCLHVFLIFDSSIHPLNSAYQRDFHIPSLSFAMRLHRIFYADAGTQVIPQLDLPIHQIEDAGQILLYRYISMSTDESRVGFTFRIEEREHVDALGNPTLIRYLVFSDREQMKEGLQNYAPMVHAWRSAESYPFVAEEVDLPGGKVRVPVVFEGTGPDPYCERLSSI